MEMQQRFTVLLQSQDPGFGRGKCMAPGNHTGAVLIHIRLIERLTDQLVGDQRRFPYHFIGQIAGSIQSLHNFLRMLRHMGQTLVSIQILRSGAKPELTIS